MACKTNQKSAVRAELRVNGKEIELNKFVENFISQAIIAMVKSLRDVGDVETISLKVLTKAK